jgi:ribokinase
MADVVVLGSLNMDLVVQTRLHPRPGETVHGSGFVTVPGGKGANQAAAAARLGASVAMVGRVGRDAFGQEIVANLAAQGVQTDHIMVDDPSPSGIAMIVVDAAGENTIVVAPGANGAVAVDDVERARELLSTASYLVLQFEIPLPVVRAAISLASSLGVRVVLNPAPAVRVAPEFFAGVYALVVNETEAQTFSGQPVSDAVQAAAAARELQSFGPEVVIVTLGAEGALLRSGELELHVPAHRVKAVDTTGAGDTFVGGLVAAMLQGISLDKAVRYATCAGTLATMRFGAQTSIPSANEVDALFERGELPQL